MHKILATAFILALTTVFLSSFLLSQIWIYVGISLYSMCYVTSERPFDTPILNRVNYLNESLLLITSYFLLLMTDLVPDVELREQIGWIYLYTLSFVVVINFIVIIQQLISTLFKRARYWSIKK